MALMSPGFVFSISWTFWAYEFLKTRSVFLSDRMTMVVSSSLAFTSASLTLCLTGASTVAMNSQQSKALDALEVARAGMLRYKLKEERNLRKRIKLSRDYDVIGVFKTHRDICDMRGKFTDANGAKFNALFQKGILNYEAGEWLVAGGALEECLALVADDGPSLALLSFMGKTQFVKPHSWRGYRSIG